MNGHANFGSVKSPWAIQSAQFIRAAGNPVTNNEKIHYNGRFLGLKERDRWEYAFRTNASGVVVLVPVTNDGELAQKILHPSHEVNKTYRATVKGKPSKKKVEMLRRGIEIDGRKTWPALVKLLSAGSRETTLQITIHEGRKRQVRKMCEAVGHPVLKLKRIAYGKLKLGNLAPGKFRFLAKKDLQLIFMKKNSSLQ